MSTADDGISCSEQNHVQDVTGHCSVRTSSIITVAEANHGLKAVSAECFVPLLGLGQNCFSFESCLTTSFPHNTLLLLWSYLNKLPQFYADTSLEHFLIFLAPHKQKSIPITSSTMKALPFLCFYFTEIMFSTVIPQSKFGLYWKEIMEGKVLEGKLEGNKLNN